MFGLNGSFYTFRSALANRLTLPFHAEMLSEKAGLLYSDEERLCIVYYAVEAEKRVPMTCIGRCIHIDEDLWATRSQLLLNRIAALMGHAQRVYARNTVVARVEKRVALSFLQEHHLQVALPGKYRYGLYHDGELVAVAVFSGGRRMAEKPTDYRSYELLRFCHKQGVHVVGGFSKLLDGFRRDFNPDDIMTYADKDWSDGSRYRKLGFTEVGETAPQLFWVDMRTMQRYYERTLPSEVAAMLPDERPTAGYVAVHNSGSIKLVYF
ncbi:hypothetical protein [Parapedobacter sp. 10938]|uniref:hypothetical protein n=1 Tax=Parapedobacter flavus TaxID=3110225 RepID=UPI002DBECA2A|nr:hypothetical protein [Parapedobacter sp. 10938]MEC3878044.1 hypothetical protein [Parapedobacter sp. 10938]